jgi:hypothetical protein
MSEPLKNANHRDANTQSRAPAIKGLPPFDEFENRLLPELRQIHEVLKPSFLFRAYELAKKKLELEAWRERLKADVPKIRVSIGRHKRIAKKIGKAIEAVGAAERIAALEDRELLKNLDVIEARRILMMADADLHWVIKEMFPGSIHPKLRNENEKPTNFNLPQHSDSSMPGFGFAKIDYWFIGELDQCLDRTLNKKGAAGRIGRDRIIQKVFEVALSRYEMIEQIKNARIRMTGKRKKSVKK